MSKRGTKVNARAPKQLRREYLTALANEEAFLAAQHFALALLAGALAVTFAPVPIGHGTRSVISIVLAAAGILTAGRALIHWKRIDRGSP